MTYDQVSDQMDAKISDALAKDGQKKVYVIYSAYRSNKRDVPIDNLEEVAVDGKVVLIQERDEFYGGEKSRHYVSAVLENPTWLQVAVCANKMIKRVRDGHHVFLEGLTAVTAEEIGSPKLKARVQEFWAEGLKVWRFSMGS